MPNVGSHSTDRDIQDLRDRLHQLVQELADGPRSEISEMVRQIWNLTGEIALASERSVGAGQRRGGR